MKNTKTAAKGASAAASGGPVRPRNLDLLSQGSEVIQPFFHTLNTLRDAVLTQAGEADSGMSRKLMALAKKIDSFEASVTLVGQVKAGKTALVNVLSGQAGLLPTDVNPWTSVVTSLHVNSKQASTRTCARFKFFDNSEWDKMVRGGGRIGELARRAGAEDDLEKLRGQIDQMRETARRRLSANYEKLLGKTHRYNYVDRELIERYVCLGDPDELALNPKSQQGKFSDITRSADVWLDVPQLSGSYLFRDTPGVNDTFLVREQITIQALRGSRVCVVVLSAHEALNSTDLALVRLISNYESRQVILFVNRIDELESPYEQVAEIYESINRTLRPYGRLRDVKVIFGSARWAEMALNGDISDLDDDAESALADWARNCDVGADPRQMPHLWKLSGIPELMRSINERIVERSGARHLAAVRASLANISAAMAAREALASGRDAAGRLASVDPAQLRDDLGGLGTRARHKLEETLSRLESDLTPALSQVQTDYVTRATDALVDHLRSAGRDESWTFNSSGLRLVLRTTCDRFSARARAQVESVFHGAASDFSGVYLGTLGLRIDGFRIEPPQVPKAPPPVVLGKTIAIDLGGTWWKRWWQRRKNPATLADEYRSLIEAEIGSVIGDLKQSQFTDVFGEIRRIFDEFLAEQTETLLDLVESSPDAGDGAADSDEFGAMIAEMLESIRLEEAPEEEGEEEEGRDPAISGDTFELRKAVGGY
ncbi:dynamin family protein [Pseudogemmobacter bohemicus]|uniref:dynamin family protein n=1 Tax=Pseudogemmobacter bohemicus TaxID=2250708 RepID=UPI001300672E|nr:dynamin family protein [Pseudogemmobacter bohemicus]